VNVVFVEGFGVGFLFVGMVIVGTVREIFVVAVGVVLLIMDILHESVGTAAKYGMMIVCIVHRFLEESLGARIFSLSCSIRAR